MASSSPFSNKSVKGINIPPPLPSKPAKWSKKEEDKKLIPPPVAPKPRQSLIKRFQAEECATEEKAIDTFDDAISESRDIASQPNKNGGFLYSQHSKVGNTEHLYEEPYCSSPDEFDDDKTSSNSTLYDYDSDQYGESTSTKQGDSGRGSLINPSESSNSNFSLEIAPSNEDGILLEGNEKKAFLAAKEIASSERVFVDCLRLICIDFQAAITDKSAIIPEQELKKILSNLPHLQNLNEELLQDFEDRLRNWTSLPKISDVFLCKGPFLKLYSVYIQDFKNQSTLLDECAKKYPQFSQVLKDFESSPRCKGLSLKHYILKPVQRLPQYRLLLEAYLQYLTESSIDYQDTIETLKIVTEVAEHANRTMTREVSIIINQLKYYR